MGARPGSGLSSSSALVCAAMLAVLAAGGARPPKAVSLAAQGHARPKRVLVSGALFMRPPKAVSLAALGPACCGPSGD